MILTATTGPKPPRQKRMTKRKQVFFRGKDFGWMLSRRLVENVARRLGVTEAEADRIIDGVGTEFRALLLAGHATGLPGCPVLCPRREARRVWNFNRRRYEHRTGVVKLRVYFPRPLRMAMRETLVDRGDTRMQYDRERTRVSGDPRPAFVPRKRKYRRA